MLYMNGPLGPIHKLRYHNMGVWQMITWGRGGQNPGRYNVIYGQEYFKNLEKIAKIGEKMKANLKI